MDMDWTVAEMDNECAVRLVGASVIAEVPHSMLVDDTVIAAPDSGIAQHQLRKFEKALAKCGFGLNSAKSAALVIRADCKCKQWITAIDSQIRTLDGGPIPIMDLEDRYSYLGLCVGYQGYDLTGIEGITGAGLGEITRAPLKPAQRMQIIVHSSNRQLLDFCVLHALAYKARLVLIV